MYRIGSALAFVAFAFGGCAESEDSPERTPPPIEDTAFGEMVGTMDKARAVQDTTMQHKEELDRRLQETEQQ